MLFQRIAVASWEFWFCVISMKFRRFFIEIRGWRCSFPARRSFAHFDDLTSVFHRIVVGAIPVLAIAISMIFHWFFNEMGLGRSRSEILLISMILLMLFHRNEVPTADSPNLAISICFHIEISQNRWQAVHHRNLHFRYVFISKFRLRRFSAIPQGTSFLEPTIRPPGGSDFDDLITVFHRNDANSEPDFVGPSI